MSSGSINVYRDKAFPPLIKIITFDDVICVVFLGKEVGLACTKNLNTWSTIAKYILGFLLFFSSETEHHGHATQA